MSDIQIDRNAPSDAVKTSTAVGTAAPCCGTAAAAAAEDACCGSAAKSEAVAAKAGCCG